MANLLKLNLDVSDSEQVREVLELACRISGYAVDMDRLRPALSAFQAAEGTRERSRGSCQASGTGYDVSYVVKAAWAPSRKAAGLGIRVSLDTMGGQP